MVVLLLLSAVVVFALAVGLVVQTRRLDAIRAAAEPEVSGPVEVITIEIRNHVELAAERTGLARPIHRVAPGLIRSLVHKETLKLLRTELVGQGVEADVRLRRLPTRSDRPVANPPCVDADAPDQPDEPVLASG